MGGLGGISHRVKHSLIERVWFRLGVNGMRQWCIGQQIVAQSSATPYVVSLLRTALPNPVCLEGLWYKRLNTDGALQSAAISHVVTPALEDSVIAAPCTDCTMKCSITWGRVL